MLLCEFFFVKTLRRGDARFARSWRRKDGEAEFLIVLTNARSA